LISFSGSKNEKQNKKKNPQQIKTQIFAIKSSTETKNTALSMTRRCLELMNEGVLEKIFFDHEYPIRVSPLDTDLQLIGRYERKKESL
jgi:hypothetical protein